MRAQVANWSYSVLFSGLSENSLKQVNIESGLWGSGTMDFKMEAGVSNSEAQANMFHVFASKVARAR